MKRKKLILVTLLVISLISFNLPLSSLLAQEGNVNDGQSEQTNNQDNNTEPEQVIEDTAIQTGDAEVGIETENETNTNIADLGGQDEEANNENNKDGETLENSQEKNPSATTTPDNLITDAPDSLATTTPNTLATTTPDNLAATSTPDILDDTTPDSLTTTTPDILATSTPETLATTTDEIIIENDNQATTTNELDGAAVTGFNSSNLNGNETSIETGNATATANLVNTVNTNITGSNFWFILSNFFYGLIGGFYVDDFSANQNNDCGLIDCASSLDVENNNTGTIVNDVELYGITGNNSASGNSGSSSITTGNAHVTANVVNLLNTNIAGSNWFFGIFNNFGDWDGNFVFPGNGAVESFIGESGPATSTPETLENNTATSTQGSINIENNSQAEVENNINVAADTGENSANGNGGGSFIETGEAQAEANVSTVANTNIFGNNWLLIAVKVFGDWSGNIFSLPDGISWLKTPDGVILYSNDLLNNQLDEENNNQEQEQAGSGFLNAASNNIAKIINNLNLFGSTGGNSASYNNGSGVISTGNATVSANVANFVNTNIIGRNWLMASINVFGDWQGSLAFGEPDIWLGASATTTNNPVKKDDYINYTLSYTNNGDADATNVVLIDNFNWGYLEIDNANGGDVSVPGQISWKIDSLPINESGSVSYSLIVKDELPYGRTYLTNNSIIDSFEDDANNEDNTDSISIQAEAYPPLGWTGGVPKLPIIEVNKTNDAEGLVHPGDIVNYKIVLNNKGVGPAYDVVLTDILRNASSTPIKTQTWELGEVSSNEEVIIEYSLLINGGIESGTHTNTVEIQGQDSRGMPLVILSGQTSSEIEVQVEEEAEETGSGGETGGGTIQTELSSGSGENTGDESDSSEGTEPNENQTGESVENMSPLSLFSEAEAAGTPEADLNGKTFKEVPNEIESENFGQYLLAGMANFWQNRLLIYLLILLALGFLALVYLKSKRKKNSF